MEDRFWAKSTEETIVEHTQKLLERYTQLQKNYPEIPVSWDLLRIACQYHDLGKMNKLFQEKIREGVMKKDGEIPHGLLSITLLPFEQLEERYERKEIKALTYAVALHHERNLSEIEEEQYESEAEALMVLIEEFPFDELDLPKPDEIEVPSVIYYKLRHKISSQDDCFRESVMLKGLLNRIDYAASGDYQIEYPANFLNKNMPKVRESWRKKHSDPTINWNEMQKYVQTHQDESLVIIGQTGLGKTEAGLLWIGDNKGFFTLPLRTAINAIYDRIRKDITDKTEDKYKEQVGILHSDSLAVLLAEQEENKEIELDQLEGYLTETRSWSLSLTVTTLDQTFDFVYHYAGFEQKLATFAYSKVVIDEIQMYSPDLLAYLIKGLKEIQDFGGKFLVMTATLPPYLLDLFEKRKLIWKSNDKPFLNHELLERHHLQILEEGISAEAVSDLYGSGKLLVICNTVRKAKEIYKELSELSVGVVIHLIHSQFIRKDRQAKEKEIQDFADSEEEGIWIATQVVEASLDIDFDLLITELSELNGLFQRMGRCYRKRSLVNREQPNVYVFDGGDQVTSGISTSEQAVVQKDIFDMSKLALRNVGSGIYSELDKMTIIDQTYTTENMKKTDYYKRIETMLQWLTAIEDDGKSAAEVRKLFRNIQSRNIIPEDVYKNYSEKIDEYLELLPLTNKELESRGYKNPKMYKQQIKSQLEDYMMSIPEWLFRNCLKGDQVRCEQIGRYDQVFFVKGIYESDVGFQVLKGEKEDNVW
jgi:CRISPR-associated endonuclease/helicase Cas3